MPGSSLPESGEELRVGFGARREEEKVGMRVGIRGEFMYQRTSSSQARSTTVRSKS
jgi:hypothetical protein